MLGFADEFAFDLREVALLNIFIVITNKLYTNGQHI